MNTDFKNLMKVDINDYQAYDPDRCCNGGAYSWHHHYSRVCENMWELTESTSGEFCPYCRSWDCTGWCRDGMEPELVTEDELQHVIAEWSSDDDYCETEVRRSGECLTIDVWSLDDHEEV